MLLCGRMWYVFIKYRCYLLQRFNVCCENGNPSCESIDAQIKLEYLLSKLSYTRTLLRYLVILNTITFRTQLVNRDRTYSNKCYHCTDIMNHLIHEEILCLSLTDVVSVILEDNLFAFIQTSCSSSQNL